MISANQRKPNYSSSTIEEKYFSILTIFFFKYLVVKVEMISHSEYVVLAMRTGIDAHAIVDGPYKKHVFFFLQIYTYAAAISIKRFICNAMLSFSTNRNAIDNNASVNFKYGSSIHIYCLKK